MYKFIFLICVILLLPCTVATAGSNVEKDVSYSTIAGYPVFDNSTENDFGDLILVDDDMFDSASVQFFKTPDGIDEEHTITFEYKTCDNDGYKHPTHRGDGFALLLGQDPNLYSESVLRGLTGGSIGVVTGKGGNGISIRFITYMVDSIGVVDSSSNIKEVIESPVYNDCVWDNVKVSIIDDYLYVSVGGREVITAFLTKEELKAIKDYPIGFSSGTGDADGSLEIKNIQVLVSN